MRKTLWWGLIIFILSNVLFYSQAFSATEDTAQLTFSKTALSKIPSQTYTIQEGDVLSEIISRIPGVNRKNAPGYYRMTKEINPNITDLNKLYIGQKILLPGKSVLKKSVVETTASTSSAESKTYQVKKGDSLIHIIRRDLHIKSGAKTQKTLLAIKSLNPDIKDVNRIYIGQIIRLPEGQALMKAGEQLAEPVEIEEQKPQKEEEEESTGKDFISLPPEARLNVIKHVITQMNGNMITAGNYYLPISGTEQVTVNCSAIPVVELDNQTIFLDLRNRSADHLKMIISGFWSNYHLVRINAKDDIIIILKKIFRNTKNYEITKSQKPVSVGKRPSLEVIVDWVISLKNAKTSSSTIQGLRFVDANNTLLPRAIVSYARKHSLIITEISPEKGLVVKPEEIYSLPPMTILPRSSARDFSYALLSSLNIPAEKDVDVGVFNIKKDGFNLSIKADITATHGEKKYIVFSRNLSPQHVNMLKKSGNELIFLSERDEPAKSMEKILRGFNFIFTSGQFTFSGLDKIQAPYKLSFSGTKIKADKDIYVVNFEFNQDLRGLLQETWSAYVVQY